MGTGPYYCCPLFLCSGNPRLAVYSQFYEHDEVVEIETSHMNMRNYVWGNIKAKNVNVAYS